MRRAAAAFATSVFVALALTGPLASTGHAQASGAITCAGASSSPECVLLDQLATQLAPLQSLLAVAGPATAELAGAVQGLAARADQAGGVPAADVAGQAQALLDQLDALPAPVRDLLPATQLNGLTSTLEELVAELAAPVEGEGGGATPVAPTPAPTGGSSAAPGPGSSSSSSSPSPAVPSLGGSVSATGSGSATSSNLSSGIPGVPVGDSLTLAPLALPDFGFSPTVGLDSSELAAPETEAAADEAVAFEAASALPDGGHTAVEAVATMCVLLVGAAVAAQANQNRQARHTIPD